MATIRDLCRQRRGILRKYNTGFPEKTNFARIVSPHARIVFFRLFCVFAAPRRHPSTSRSITSVSNTPSLSCRLRKPPYFDTIRSMRARPKPCTPHVPRSPRPPSACRPPGHCPGDCRSARTGLSPGTEHPGGPSPSHPSGWPSPGLWTACCSGWQGSAPHSGWPKQKFVL